MKAKIIVTSSELEELEEIHMKREALGYLIKSLTEEDTQIYNKILDDYAVVQNRYQKWWIKMGEKYNLGDYDYAFEFNTGCIVPLDEIQK